MLFRSARVTTKRPFIPTNIVIVIEKIVEGVGFSYNLDELINYFTSSF